MDKKLKELMDELYQDGVKRGNSEAEELISNAKHEADKILEKAKNEATTILKNAENEALSKKKRIESEINLTAKQVIARVKEEIANLVALKSTDVVSGAFNDGEFIKNLILKVVENWNKVEQGGGLNLVVSEKDRDTLDSFIKKTCAGKLHDTIQVSSEDGLTKGFKVSPKNSSFVIEFTEDSFKEFFFHHLRPMSKEVLFQNN